MQVSTCIDSPLPIIFAFWSMTSQAPGTPIKPEVLLELEPPVTYFTGEKLRSWILLENAHPASETNPRPEGFSN